jgi:hypothetical protein
MIVLRKLFSEKTSEKEKKGLTPEQKKSLAKRGIEVGVTSTGLGAIGYGTAKLGEKINQMGTREAAEKVVNKKLPKKLKKWKVAENPELKKRLVDAVQNKQSKQLNKAVEKRLNKVIDKKIKKWGVADTPELRNRLLDKAYDGINKLGVDERKIKTAKRTGKVLATVGVPLTAYSIYRKHKSNKEIAQSDAKKENENSKG